MIQVFIFDKIVEFNQTVLATGGRKNLTSKKAMNHIKSNIISKKNLFRSVLR